MSEGPVHEANRRFAAGDASAAAILSEAAEAGDPLAMLNLGQRLTHGMGLAVDATAGAAWIARAAEAGFPPAMEAFGRARLAIAPEDGRAWLRRAAQAGFAPAMAELAAALLAAGEQRAEAEHWLRAGMAAGLGRAFALAAELEAEPAAAEDLLLEALRRRDVPAGLSLGMRRYRRGDFAGAAAAFGACLRLGADAARINVAAMRRRGEWPADRAAPDVEALIGELAAAGEPFAVVNMALWRLARGEATEAAARAAVAALPEAGRAAVRPWWAELAAAGDPEGERVLGWLS